MLKETILTLLLRYAVLISGAAALFAAAHSRCSCSARARP